MKRRLFSLLLCGVMLFSMCTPAAALEQTGSTGGLCPHHQEHSYEVCGYIEAMEGQPCGYVCPTCSMQAMNDLPMLAADETGDFTVSGGEKDTDYTYENNYLTIKTSTGRC